MTRLFGIAALIAALVHPVPSVPARPAAPALPNLPVPRAMLRSAGPALGAQATVLPRIIRVPAGGNLQAAIDAARPGDFIELEAGATFVGNFELRYKEGEQWIVIYSSAFWRLPPPGDPLTPAQHAAFMPKIVSPNDSPAIFTTPDRAHPAHHYAFIGVEVTTTSPLNFNLIWLKTFMQQSLAEVPTDIIFYRCYIHGTPTGDMRRGIALNGARMAIIGSYLSDFHSTAIEAQAIMGWNGPGPYWIVGNYIEAAGEGVMFGGDDPSIQWLVPADIEIRANHFSKPLSWRQGDPSYAGIPWVVKNLLELKNARRVRIEGNLFEQNWGAHQHGFAILFTPRNEFGGATPPGLNCTWCVVEDVTFTNNIVRRAAGGIQLLGWDNFRQSEQAKGIVIRNNLFVDIGMWPSIDPNFTGTLFWMQDGTDEVVIDHNTALHTGNPLVASTIVSERKAHTSYVFTNNIVQNSRFGVVGVDPLGDPMSPALTLGTYFPAALFTRNVLVGGNLTDYPADLFPDNFFPLSLAGVGFEDPDGGDYDLAPTSPFRNLATDGTDIGADMTALQEALLRWP